MDDAVLDGAFSFSLDAAPSDRAEGGDVLDRLLGAESRREGLSRIDLVIGLSRSLHRNGDPLSLFNVGPDGRMDTLTHPFGATGGLRARDGEAPEQSYSLDLMFRF